MGVRRRVGRMKNSRDWRWIGNGRGGEEAEGGDDHVLS